MMHVLALGSRTSHDGGIADRRDVVATYGSCHTSGDGDDAQRISLWEHGDADRYQDTKCAPRRTRGKSKEGCHDEDDGW